VAAIEAQTAHEEGDAGGRPLVVEDLGVGQPGGVVDADVDELPTDTA
jgi:hypothetical protein